MISSSDLSPGGLTGRAAETSAIRRTISQSRVLTVTGPPGVGKTATAIAAAASSKGSRFRDGVWLIKLDALQDETLLPHTIAAAMLLPDTFGVSPLEALIDGLRDKRVLLLLDTCEHLIGACASIGSALIESCPGVRILATSREPLRIPGEQTITVGPLAERDCVRLLLQRANPSGALDNDLLAAVCRKLDGLPLAIGMAARQLTHGSLDALLAGLDSGYDFLSDPTAPVARHQSLQAAIGWSHQLCTPAERLLWARLSVFDMPFCIKDCQEVCATTHLTDEAISVGVGMLTERSLLLYEPGEPARWRMPATIRAYGLGMLRRLAEEEEMRRRYRRWRSGPRRDAFWQLPPRGVVSRLPLP
ncbi:MAG TPA: NB-ARC domain-containing protein [Streptosporangiaceae bacterium]|nr:NB-ARC domain-containing protein [Streptosporangiaceae bacterium]